MEAPERCPECRSREVRVTTRLIGGIGEVDVVVCGNCDWASDRRVGRPPADRSKNLTLRRLLAPPKPTDDETADE